MSSGWGHVSKSTLILEEPSIVSSKSFHVCVDSDAQQQQHNRLVSSRKAWRFCKPTMQESRVTGVSGNNPHLDATIRMFPPLEGRKSSLL